MPTTLSDLPEDIIRIIINVVSSKEGLQLKHVRLGDLGVSDDVVYQYFLTHHARDGDEQLSNIQAAKIWEYIEDVCSHCDHVCLRIKEYQGRPRRIIARCCRGIIIKKESLSLRDILNLRETCRRLSNCLVDIYLQEFSGCHLAKTGHADVSMTPEGLRSFHASSTSQLIANNIKYLHFNVGRITVETKAGRYRLEPLLRRDAIEYRKLNDLGEDVQLLSSALAHLPNLEEIHVGKWRAPHRFSPETWYYKSSQTGYYGSIHTSTPYGNNQQGAGCQWRADILNGIVQALAQTSTSIKKFVVHSGTRKPNWEETGIWGFDIPQRLDAGLTKSFAQLKEVHLTISRGEDLPLDEGSIVDNGAPLDFTEAKGVGMLLQFLSSMPQLESLRLITSEDNIFTVDFIHKVLLKLPAALKALHLYNSFMTVQVLSEFLITRWSQLTEISLCRVFLVHERWTRLLRLMQSLTSESSLKFSLGELWELKSEVGQKVLVRPPSWHGNVHVRIERVPFTYCRTDINDGPPVKVLDHVCKVFGKKLEDFKMQPKNLHRPRLSSNWDDKTCCRYNSP